MTAKRQSPQYSEQSTPDVFEDTTTPQRFATHDHSFTLQAIMQLQKDTGQLTECVNSLRQSMDKHGEKLDRLEDKLSGVTHKIYAATAVLAILVALGSFIVNKAWDIMARQITITANPPPVSSQQPIPPSRKAP